MEMYCNLGLAGWLGWGDAGLKLLSDCSLSGSARRRDSESAAAEPTFSQVGHFIEYGRCI